MLYSILESYFFISFFFFIFFHLTSRKMGLTSHYTIVGFLTAIPVFVSMLGEMISFTGSYWALIRQSKYSECKKSLKNDFVNALMYESSLRLRCTI